MAGKAYTLREMRAIVEYLNEHKAYGELKGRKMWMIFASSDKTTRTWQSLKETFLKRILPDIQNPYYKLTMDQVRSFRQGVDVVEKEKNNRLEFQTTDEKSNAGEQNGISTAVIDNETPTTSHENEKQMNVNDEPPVTSIDDELEKVTGEDVKAAKIPSRCRSSAETLVLEYENAEDIQRALESPSNDLGPKSKSLKDMLIFEYSAPLTPLVRDLLEDFVTESEGSDAEPRLNIDEDRPRTGNNETEAAESETVTENALEHIKVEIDEANSTTEICDTENMDNTVMKTAVTEVTSNNDPIQAESVEPNNHENQEPSSQNENNENNNNIETNAQKHNVMQNSRQCDAVTNAMSNLKDTTVTAESSAKTCEKSLDTGKNNTDSNSIIANTGSSTQNNTSDTLLPNNQEALDDSKKDAQKAKDAANNEITDEKKTSGKESRLRKRSSSKDSKKSKKQKLLNIQSEEINDDASIPIIEIRDSASPILGKKSVNANTPTVEISSNTATSYMEDQLAKRTSKSVNKSSAYTDKDINTTLNKEENTTEVEDKNPCLLSVSLFEEQFKNTKYSDSDTDEATKQKRNLDKPQTITYEVKTTKAIPQKIKDKKEAEVVVEKELAAVVENRKKMDRHLDSSADCESQNQRVSNNTNVNASVNLQRERALANVFGFAHGHVAPTTRKRKLSHRRMSHHYRRRQSKNVESNSSEWSSESDSESYVSPPARGSRNRHTKKYLIPKRSRILQDPEEGMLYVVTGKSIYPLVKDGKHIKKFLTLRPDSDSDVEESFWRKKYVEEKRRVEEVKKLLNETKQNNATRINESTQPSTSRNNTSASPQIPAQNGNNNNAIAPIADNKTEGMDAKKLLLKIAGSNGVEYSLEGDWDQISHVMPQVVRMVKSEVADDKGKPNQVNKADERNETKVEVQMETSSGVSTPAPSVVDTDVHEKVNKIEDAIFDKIKILEAQQMEEEIKTSETGGTNVTRRKVGRPRKPISSTSKSPAKLARKVKSNSTDSKQEEPKTKRASRTKPTIHDAKQEEKDIPAVKQNMIQITEDNPEQKEMESPKKVAEKPVVEKRGSVRRSESRLSKRTDTSDHNSTAGDTTAGGTRVSARIQQMPKKYDTDSSASEAKLRPIPTPTLTPTKQPTEQSQRSFDDENARYMFPPDKIKKTNPGHKRR